MKQFIIVRYFVYRIPDCFYFRILSRARASARQSGIIVIWILVQSEEFIIIITRRCAHQLLELCDKYRLLRINLCFPSNQERENILRACSYQQKLSRLARKHSTSQIILFSSYGEKLSRLPGNFFGSDERNNESFPALIENKKNYL